MKTAFSIILSIVLLILTISRFASRCSKAESRERSSNFNEARNRIETERYKIFQYDYDDKDSVKTMMQQARVFGKVLDSTITYYRNNYKQDEKRHDAYLEVLYEYKKMSYVYFGWLQYLKDSSSTKRFKIQYPIKLREFNNKLQEIRFGQSRSYVGY